MLGIPKISIAQLLKIRKHALNAYSVGLLQGKAYRVLEKNLSQTLSWYGLSIHEWKFLGQLADNQFLSEEQLAKRLDITTTTVHKLGKKLHDQKLVTFGKTETKLKISPKGKELTGLVEVAVKDKMKMLLLGVTRAEMLIYLKVLMHIVDNG